MIRSISRLTPLISLTLFGVTLWFLHRALREHSFHDVMTEFRSLPASGLALALLLTAISYVILTGYDWLALRHIGRKVSYPKIALSAFISYVFSHNLGFSLLTGGSIRYRIYSAEGLSALEIGMVTLLCATTFSLGATTISGLALLLEPTTVLSVIPLPAALPQVAGAMCLALVAGYVIWGATRKRAISIRNWSVRVPSVSICVMQIALAVFDIVVATSALFILLPTGAHIAFPAFLGIYVLAIVAGILSHVPGGLGVVEGVVLLLLPQAPPDALLASLLAFRVIYYIIPLGISALLLGGYELAQHVPKIARATASISGIAAKAAPPVLGTFVLVSGAVLLLSGASPAVDARLEILRDIVPLPVLEVSHLIGSLVGVGLLIVARGLFRRLDSAYHLTLFLLAAGIVASLIKGLDFEEALLLSVVLAALVGGRSAFYRRASMLSLSFSPSWILTMVVIFAGAVWLGLFSYKHVEYQNDLWWQFAFSEDAPRFLRASFGAVALAVSFGVYMLMRPAAPALGLPAPADLDRAKAIIAKSRSAISHLALVGDKHLLFNDLGTAFLMYDVQGRTWVTMGDPVGPESEFADLAWTFRELCDRHGGRPAFYQVTQMSLPICIDLGLSLLKIGEDARVPLRMFSLDGSSRRDLRYAKRRAAKEGATFEVVPPETTASLLVDLAAVSNAWLAEKHTAEKGFSVGAFEPDYLRHLPCAIVKVGNRIVAFANIWSAAEHEEVSVDLMRYVPDAPYGIMDFLFAELMLWGREQGYRWFSLGMVPLSGLEDHPLAPLWHRLGTILFRHGEHFYNFEGLRSYKEKFEPVWEPRYLACPGGLATAQALLDVGRLISGGLKGMVAK
jgi:phosphatidylglycerol lysyltransferase